MCVQYRKDFYFMMQGGKKMITKAVVNDTNKHIAACSGSRKNYACMLLKWYLGEPDQRSDSLLLCYLLKNRDRLW